MQETDHGEPEVSTGQLFMDPNVETARAFFRDKPRTLTNKLVSVAEAVSTFIHDGDYLASGGFGGVRIASALLHEIVRQRRRHLGLSAYVVGLEMRGLSPNARRIMESGEVAVTEWTNATLDWRYKAASMGVPFLPARTMLGTDTFKHSAAKVITCPFTAQKLLAVPALFPDVAIIHVHRADVFGNCQIDGITIADFDVARASKRVIISTERLVSTDEIRREPVKTLLPYYLVDAVCHVPNGSYPGNMPYEYYSDEGGEGRGRPGRLRGPAHLRREELRRVPGAEGRRAAHGRAAGPGAPAAGVGGRDEWAE
jgi:glutaconate CoA-transferase subunit A